TPSSELLPHVALARACARGARRHSETAIEYVHPPGYEPLRRALASRLVDGIAGVSPSDVVITNGATEAIQLCLRAVARAGDTIAVESPTYYGALQAIEALGMRALPVPSDPVTGLSIVHLRRSLARKKIAACFAMPNFGNPLGAAMPDVAKRE